MDVQKEKEKLIILAKELDKRVKPNNISLDEIVNEIKQVRKKK